MAGAHPVVRAFSDLNGVIETFGLRDKDDPETRYTKYTTCYVYDDDDKAYFGQVFKEKKKITVEEFAASLRRVPDEEIYPEIPLGAKLTAASTMGQTTRTIFIKRPSLLDYEEASGHGWIRRIFLAEALIMEQIAAAPHPNIAKYFGCRMRDGFLTGIVLERHDSSLNDHYAQGRQSVDADNFMAKLGEAVHHLHSLGLAHNDLNPNNVMLDKAGDPVLIDFGSCQPFGGRLMQAGTIGWCDGPIHFSDKRHDDSALGKMRNWLEDPERTFL